MSVSLIEFEKALGSLKEALDALKKTSLQDLVQFRFVRDATVQRYEFSIELAWKVSAKVLGSSSTTAKPVIREMAQNGLVDSPQVWFDFIEGRNKTSHAYDETIANSIVQTAELFYPEAKTLLERLKQK